MSFIQPAFIRKNTLELREKLKQLGHQICSCCDNESGWLFTSHSDDVHAVHEEERVEFLADANERQDMSDCRKNEEMFLALAALRDDTDNNQWFTNGKDWALYRDRSSGGIAGFDFFNFPADMDINNLHKASADVIIEHFKDT